MKPRELLNWFLIKFGFKKQYIFICKKVSKEELMKEYEKR
jgi:hypothetical protein